MIATLRNKPQHVVRKIFEKLAVEYIAANDDKRFFLKNNVAACIDVLGEQEYKGFTFKITNLDLVIESI